MIFIKYNQSICFVCSLKLWLLQPSVVDIYKVPEVIAVFYLIHVPKRILICYYYIIYKVLGMCLRKKPSLVEGLILSLSLSCNKKKEKLEIEKRQSR